MNRSVNVILLELRDVIFNPAQACGVTNEIDQSAIGV